VYFLLDEFRQLKKMSDITDKMPYVAEYNIKMAFIIQDLKNLDEIYGETARHSLLGNCGYQLVLGANDQATADYASRALGKRTARYKSESRTIELFGWPRRTKVEQIRERDLMMPQEIRQMPADKIILIVQGQQPIFGDKLRFFETQPFKSAVAYSYANVPDVPPIEYLPERPVLATTEAYVGQTGPTQEFIPVVAADSQNASIAGATQRRTLRTSPTDNSKSAKPAIQPRNPTGMPRKGSNSKSSGERSDHSLIRERARHAEERLKPTAEKLKQIVSAKVGSPGATTPQRRRSYLEIFDATVPDPLDIGLTT
jgi:type IV secretion system protein VirD4